MTSPTSPYDAYKKLAFERPSPNVLEVILLGDGRGNAVGHELHGEMARVWNDIDADREVNAVILRGRDDAFGAGGHVDLVEQLGRDFQLMVESWKEARGIVYNIINCSKPVVAAIRGPVAGAALAAALSSDITIASKTARINDAHVKLGMCAGDHAVINWPLLCGMAKAKLHLLLNDTLSGEEAERIGLVSMCVEDGEVYDKAREVAARLAQGAQTAIRWTKYSLNNWLRMNGPSFDASLAYASLTFMGPDIAEGIAAIREKRAPHFSAGSPL
jgi:enoyl-CoA hydratase